MEYFGTYTIAQFLILKGVAVTYLFAFANVINEFRLLLGEDGLLPVPEFLKRTSFWDKPSIFHWYYSDSFAQAIGWIGVLLSAFVLVGSPFVGPWWIEVTGWFLLWVLYLSVVNVGQTWYSFGWESKLLEAGFLAIFLGSAATAAPTVVIFLFRWMLFRVEFGAGLIKIRGDRCWRNLTCMDYHYETQPMPNPLSWLFHNLPTWFHRMETGFNHFVQLIVPFGLFFPQPIVAISASLIIISQSYLLASGNYSWLNFLTIVLAFAGISDGVFQQVLGITAPATTAVATTVAAASWCLLALVVYLSIQPIKNLLSRGQLMNYSFNPFHLVNTYGAFGSVTKNRWELVVEGRRAGTDWQAYKFKGKPTNPNRMPRQVAPYHLRLDWLMWFAAIAAGRAGRSAVLLQYPWLQALTRRLAQNDPDTLSLLKNNPFPQQGPNEVRVLLYKYQFTTPSEYWQTGQWWRREQIKAIIPPTNPKQ